MFTQSRENRIVPYYPCVSRWRCFKVGCYQTSSLFSIVQIFNMYSENEIVKMRGSRSVETCRGMETFWANFAICLLESTLRHPLFVCDYQANEYVNFL